MSEGIIVAIISGLVAIASMTTSTLTSIFAPRREHKKQKLFDTQWEVLAKMYSLISETDSAFELHMSPLTEMKYTDDEQRRINEAAAGAFNNMTDYYLKNRIFIPLEAADKLEALIKKMHHNIWEYDRIKSKNERRADVDYDKMYEIWEEQRNGKIKDIKCDIEKAFRRILGAN